MIIVDTGPLVAIAIAIANDRDQYHEKCMTLLAQHRGPYWYQLR